MRVFFWNKNAEAQELNPRILGYFDIPDEVPVSAVVDFNTYEYTTDDLSTDWENRWVIGSSQPHLFTPVGEITAQARVSPDECLFEITAAVSSLLTIEVQPFAAQGLPSYTSAEIGPTGVETIQALVSGVYNFALLPPDTYPDRWKPIWSAVINTENIQD